MTHRTFRDTAGYEWSVWDVYPAAPERRAIVRRQGLEGDGRLVERRAGDRRQRRLPRAVLGGDYATGWLCFQSADVRRRHAPVPAGWTEWSAAKLEECCRQASPVKTSRRAG